MFGQEVHRFFKKASDEVRRCDAVCTHQHCNLEVLSKYYKQVKGTARTGAGQGYTGLSQINLLHILPIMVSRIAVPICIRLTSTFNGVECASKQFLKLELAIYCQLL